MRSIIGVSLFALTVVALQSNSRAIAQAKSNSRFVPAKGTTLLIVGQDKSSIADHASKVNVKPAGVMLYTSIQRLEALTKPEESGGAVQDAKHLLETYPNSVLQVGLYMVNAIDDVASGKLDDNIDKLADWIKGTKRPIYLRIGYEFDLPENKYPPDVYIKAFKRIRERMEQRGATNTAYVWHSYAANNSRTAGDWYPGDGYVDWIAVSFFSLKQPHLETIAQFARQRNKPLMIAESTPRGLGTNNGKPTWDGWFAPLFRYIATYDVRALCYIDRDWEAIPRWQGKGWGDTRIASNDLIKANWLKEIGGKRYLKGADDLFANLGYK